jgi:GT2 family glycosyltransferase
VRLIVAAENLGFAGGNNRALEEAKGDLVLLLNNDTVVNPDFLQVLADYLANHPSVGIVQGKMLLPRHNNTLDVCGSFATALGLPYHYGYFKVDSEKYNRAYPVFCGKGACLMFRREVVEKSGGMLFDRDFFCYYEETDFCHRAWLAGYETHFVPSPPIEHFMGATSDRMKQGFTLQHYLRNMSFSLWGNLSVLWLMRIMPLFLAMQMLAFLVAAGQGRGWQCRAHWQAFTCVFTQLARIRQRRKLVAQIRRQTDAQIFQKIMRTPRPSYFLKTASGHLASYVDEV